MLTTLSLGRRCVWSSIWSSLVSLPTWASLCQCFPDLLFVSYHSLLLDKLLEVLRAILINSVISLSSLSLESLLIHILLVLSNVFLPLGLILSLLLLREVSLSTNVEGLNLVIFDYLLLNFHLRAKYGQEVIILIDANLLWSLLLYRLILNWELLSWSW